MLSSILRRYLPNIGYEGLSFVHPHASIGNASCTLATTEELDTALYHNGKQLPHNYVWSKIHTALIPDDVTSLSTCMQ